MDSIISMTANDVDGFYARHFHRPIAKRLSRLIGKRMSANAMTASSLVLGSGAAALISFSDAFFTAALLLQIYCVLSCLDGEIARSMGTVSQRGDFFDTITDRFVEIAILYALIFHTEAASSFPEVVGWQFLFLGAVYLIAYMSEKFRATYKRGYPKASEGVFQYITSGVDARLTMYSCALFFLNLKAFSAVSSGIAIFVVLLAANIIYRFRRIIMTT